MFVRASLACALAAALIGPSGSRPDGKSTNAAEARAADKKTQHLPASENAATYYRQAFAAIPKNAPDRETLLKAIEGAAPDVQEALVKPFSKSLNLVRLGSEQHECTWDDPAESGLDKQRTFLTPLRQVTYAAWLQMDADFRYKRYAEMSERAIVFLRLSRHLQADRLWVTHLVAGGTAHGTIESIAPAIGQAPTEIVRELAENLKRLPPKVHVARAFRGEVESQVAHVRYLTQLDPAELPKQGDLLIRMPCRVLTNLRIKRCFGRYFQSWEHRQSAIPRYLTRWSWLGAAKSFSKLLTPSFPRMLQTGRQSGTARMS